MVELLIVLVVGFGLVSAGALGKAWKHGAECDRAKGVCNDKRD
ncbi:hypothetical protein [Tardibacter chloracetimidivorans]|nr:hypothetical protein [Tardibacter chloracetimidivorans]